MALSDKIIQLRKQKGWSQEDLAFKLDLSRQAISKWESGQAVPSIENIVQLSDLFGVSVDYLIKDGENGFNNNSNNNFNNDFNSKYNSTTNSGSTNSHSQGNDTKNEYGSENFDGANNSFDEEKAKVLREVDLDQAQSYIALRKKAAVQIAIASVLCVTSPVPLFAGLGISMHINNLTEDIAAIAGIIALLIFVICAVPLFVYNGMKVKEFAFIAEPTPFKLSEQAKEEATAGLNDFKKTYMICNIVGVCLCIFSPIPLIATSFTDNVLAIMLSLSGLLCLVAVGVYLFVFSAVRSGAYKQLLQEGDFSPAKKRQAKIMDNIGSIYWISATALYLIISFTTNRWDITWLVFAICGVLYPVINTIVNIVTQKKK